MTNFKFPKTILEYAKFINDIGLLKTVTVSGKDVDNKIAASNEFQVILTNRPSTKSHDISAFLASLNEWKIAIGENSVKEVEG